MVGYLATVAACDTLASLVQPTKDMVRTLVKAVLPDMRVEYLADTDQMPQDDGVDEESKDDQRSYELKIAILFSKMRNALSRNS